MSRCVDREKAAFVPCAPVFVFSGRMKKDIIPEMKKRVPGLDAMIDESKNDEIVGTGLRLHHMEQLFGAGKCCKLIRHDREVRITGARFKFSKDTCKWWVEITPFYKNRFGQWVQERGK